LYISKEAVAAKLEVAIKTQKVTTSMGQVLKGLRSELLPNKVYVLNQLVLIVCFDRLFLGSDYQDHG
jgi:hypothetical protein